MGNSVISARNTKTISYYYMNYYDEFTRSTFNTINGPLAAWYKHNGNNL